MKVPFCLDTDFETNEFFDWGGDTFLITQTDLSLAKKLFYFLNSQEGQNIIDFLNKKDQKIVLYEINDTSVGYSLIQIALSGQGLVSNFFVKEKFIPELTSEVSCLHTCYFGKFVCGRLFVGEKLISKINKEFKKIAPKIHSRY
ncbi:MAG: hypothetical protein WCJ74_01785 [bacterium]